MHAPEVVVEAHLANGLPAFTLVGLPETEVKEARDRVRAAIQNAHYEFPARRITVNLAPADLPKESGRFDLPIALAILAASGQVPADRLKQAEFAGELALTGELRPVRGALAMAIATRTVGRQLVLPAASACEAALAQGVETRGAASLLEVCAWLAGQTTLALPEAHEFPPAPDYPDFADIKGQAAARRALEVAAAGGHSVLMSGPPGTGKSMLAARFPGILPAMDETEALEAAAVASLNGGFRQEHWRRRPFRAPHHTASAVALVGGGGNPRPGEISLAHHGVLFLDELPEFSRQVLEVLREPLETGHITISRAARQADFPARFQLVAAMNPCPWGYLGHPTQACRDTPDQITRYRARISGPLLDRIDIRTAPRKASVARLSGDKPRSDITEPRST
jgi:magnesium chelatase family protein